MKRKVEIENIGLEGLTLKVTFKGMSLNRQFREWGAPELETQYYSYGVDDKSFHVISQGFLEAGEAEKWIEELTQQVKQIDELYSQQLVAKINDFKRLEGEIEI